MDCISWTSVNEELFMNNCPWTTVHVIQSMDKCLWTTVLRQLSMDKLYLKPGWRNIFMKIWTSKHMFPLFCREMNKIRFTHSRGQNQSRKKSSWTIFFSRTLHSTAELRTAEQGTFCRARGAEELCAACWLSPDSHHPLQCSYCDIHWKVQIEWLILSRSGADLERSLTPVWKN